MLLYHVKWNHGLLDQYIITTLLFLKKVSGRLYNKLPPIEWGLWCLKSIPKWLFSLIILNYILSIGYSLLNQRENLILDQESLRALSPCTEHLPHQTIMGKKKFICHLSFPGHRHYPSNQNNLQIWFRWLWCFTWKACVGWFLPPLL